MKVRKIKREEIEVPDLPLKIAQAQEKSGKPISEVCESVGFSRTYWYRLVNGKEEAIAVETLRKLEKTLNTSFEVKFEGEANA